MPDDSFLRIEDEDQRKRLYPVLHALYEFESERVSGSHGGERRFSECIWNRDEALTFVSTKLTMDTGEAGSRLDELIELMSNMDTRHMLRFEIDGVHHHITRVAEMVRTVSNMHEFQNRDVGSPDPLKFPIIDGTRWEPRLRHAALRNITITEVIERVRSNFDHEHHLPDSMGGHHVDTALEDLQLVIEATNSMPKFGGNLRFSEFQANAIETALRHSWASDTHSAMALTAGTGMGKTLGFAIPVITDALIANRASGRVCSQLLIYPRNDLAKDQFEEVKTTLRYVNKSLIDRGESDRCIGAALDADGQIKNHKRLFPAFQGAPEWGAGGGNVYESSLNTYAGDNPASIIACSIESFRRRLRIPDVYLSLRDGLRRMVFDEVHLSSGTQGGHHSKIVSRCKQIAYPRKLNFIGVSATIAKPREHIYKIADVPAIYVDHVDADSLLSEAPMGIMHHIMIRPREGTPIIGALVDMTSAVTHQRRSRGFYERNPRPNGGWDYKRLQKTVAFSDSHEVVGGWYSFFLDNESTTLANRRLATVLPNPNVRRPFSHWHERPLRIHPGGDEVCESCQKMKHHNAPISVTETDIPRFRENTTDTLGVTSSSWHLPMFEGGGAREISGLQTCPHLEAGTCWWFAPREGVFEPRPDDPGYVSFRDVVRPKRHTGKTKSSTSDSESEGRANANYTFESPPNRGAYPRIVNDGDIITKIPHDLAIATPTLEVGVDMDNVSDVLTHKAIRNISSYRQKVGRAGRESGSDAVAMTLMSMRGQDFQHYRSMTRLVDADIIDPVPVANNNLAVKKNQAYEAVFDYISSRGHHIELIPKLRQPNPGAPDAEWSGLNTSIRDAARDICTFNGNNPTGITGPCDQYVMYATKVDDPEIRKEAAKTVAKHLMMFLEEMPVGVTVIQWLASNNADLPLNTPEPGVNPQLWPQLEDLVTTNLSMHRDSLNQQDIPFFDDLISTLREAISSHDVAGVNAVAGEFNKWGGAPSFAGILTGYSSMLTPGPIETEICRQAKQAEKHAQTNYLSTMMMACPIFLEDSPYTPLKTLFENPHEAPIVVELEGRPSESITGKEALSYVLPGMWTHRLFDASRAFVMHRGSSDLDVDGRWKMHLDGHANCPVLDPRGMLAALDAQRIPPLLDLPASTGMQTFKIKRLKVNRDFGSDGRPNHIRGGQGQFEGLYADGFYRGDVLQGLPGMLLRPKAYPISWLVSRVDEFSENPVCTYQVSQTVPAADEEPASHPATGHPLLHTMFSSIDWVDDMTVSRIALGVARSNQQILKPTVNEEHVALVDKFHTHGIRFTLKEDLLLQSEELGRRSDHPFDERVLRMLGSWILREKGIFGGSNGFIVRPYLDILVDEAWCQSNPTVLTDSFPSTGREFVELLFDSGNVFDPSVFQRRADSANVASDDMRDDMVANLIELHNLVLQNSEHIRTNYEEMMAEWYRSTLLNTLGHALSESVSELAGVQGDAVSYTYNDDAGDDCWIDVFDDDAEGNGSIQLAKTYFHIPIEIRDLAHHFDDRNLPSSSFTEVLERRLQMCQEHILHSISISGARAPSGTPSWMSSESEDFAGLYRDDWNLVGADSTREAALHNRRRFSIAAAGDRSELLDFQLAFSLCDVGCPACRGDDFSNLLPVHLIEYGTCPAVLDDVLGDWADKEGYKRQFSDSDDLARLSGNNVPSEKFIYIKGNKSGSLGVLQTFVQYPSPPVAFAWTRNMPIPEEMDFWVRHLELL